MDDKAIQEFTLDDLNRMHTESVDCDKQIFAEMRTNLQLVSGNHYVREGSRYWNRVQNNRQLSSEQKLKLTKNHTQRATKIYRNMIESAAPDVQCVANNERELKDQKAAELHDSYWGYIKECNDFPSLRAVWAKNFVEMGEVACKIFWDMNGGQEVAVEAEAMRHPDGKMMLDEQGQPMPMMDEQGQPIASDIPVYSGRIKIETIEAYNLKRDSGVSAMHDSPYLTIEKLISKKKLRTFLSKEQAGQLDRAKVPTNYTIFDNNTNTYRQATEQVMIKEMYWKPCPNARNGYFYIFTDAFVMEQGELPYGIFPIVWMGFDEQTGNPRCHSVIRHGRPAQIEINRCASKIAEHQITLGDDKVYIQANAKLTQGATLPGIRSSMYTGGTPIITPGRSGEQYFPYLESQINELYKLMNLEEITQEIPDSPDLYANLLRSYRFKRKFSIYGEKFERFLQQVAKTALQISKKSASEEELVPAIGKSQYINIPEFKNSEDIHYQIKIKPKSDDVESQFGKQITMNHALQYIGNSLSREDIGKMLRNAPFLNEEQMFKEFTEKYDCVTNDIVAMDRGQWRPPRKYQDHDYIIGKFSARMGQSDYEFLPPQIQQMYEKKLQLHEQIKAEQLQQIERAKQGFIPSGGFLVTCDFYINDPVEQGKTKRLRLPSEALDWLVKQLEMQGSALKTLELQPKGVLTDLAGMIEQNQPRQLMGVPNAVAS